MIASKKKLKQSAGLLNDAAPENHILAYITPQERDMLVDAGGVKTPTPSGIFAYPPLGQPGTSPGTTTSGGSAFSGGGGGGGGRDASQSDFSPPSAPSADRDEPLDIEDFREIPTQEVPVIFEPQPVVYDDVVQPNNQGTLDPGFVRALDEQARRQADPVYGDPDPYIDDPISERDTITSFLDNYAANVASNPFELGLIGALKTSYQTNKAKEMMRGTPGYEFLDYGLGDNSVVRGDEGGQALTNIISQAPFAISGTTPQQSMVNQYFANMGMTQGSPLSSQLQTDYNNAKNSINSILGVNQQFGYSTDPYGGLMASNLATNPFNIPYMRTRGLI